MELHKQMLTQNDCYQAGRTMVPKGVMVHSTGANNPCLRRYVAPDDGVLGLPSSNHWNQGGTGACVHAFIGKTAAGTIAAYQTLPWTMRGWHAGKGSRGTANDTHISFELCEDGLEDPAYFEAVYRAAVELTAYLCKQFHLDPLADGVVICHSEGCQRGIASNHADVMHWFPKFGKDMDHFRADVAQILKGEEPVTQEQFNQMMDTWLAQQAQQPASSWAKDTLAQAVSAGLTDGSRPQAFATRQEVATMVLAGTR